MDFHSPHWTMPSYRLFIALLLCWCLKVIHSQPPSIEPQWSWLDGSKSMYDPGVYGEKGIPSSLNHPGARYAAVGWYDSVRQEYWLFGGFGRDGVNGVGYMNDLWRYRVSDSTWTWISGSNKILQLGVYGEKGKANPNNFPGARYGAFGWYDNLREEFWLFGGLGYDNTSSGYLNDLWRYRMNDSTWTWMGGTAGTNQRGIPDSENWPGSRENALSLYDSCTHSFLLFGGNGFLKFPQAQYLNDVWMLSFVETCLPHHQLINNTCVPFIDCSSDNSNSDECTLQCGARNASTSGEQTPCLIDEDVIVNGRILESSTISIVGNINVTGDVIIIGKVTVKLSVGAELHVGRCLLLDDDITMTNGSVVLSYDRACSSQNLINRVIIESTLVDECRDGRPTIDESTDTNGRTLLTLLYVPSSECNTDGRMNIVAIAVAVPISVLVIVVIVVVVSVPKVREKVFPFTRRAKRS